MTIIDHYWLILAIWANRRLIALLAVMASGNALIAGWLTLYLAVFSIIPVRESKFTARAVARGQNQRLRERNASANGKKQPGSRSPSLEG